MKEICFVFFQKENKKQFKIISFFALMRLKSFVSSRRKNIFKKKIETL